MSLPPLRYCDACKGRVREALSRFPGNVGRGDPCTSCLKSRIRYVDQLYRDRLYRNHLAAQYCGLPCPRSCRQHLDGYEYFPDCYPVSLQELGFEYHKKLLKSFDKFDRPSHDAVSGLEVLMEESEYCQLCYWKANDAFPSRMQEGYSASDAVPGIFSPFYQNLIKSRMQEGYSKNDAFLSASTSRMQEIYTSNFSITLCGDCINRRHARIESFYGDCTYAYKTDMQHIAFTAPDENDQRNSAYWREVLEIENISHLDWQWREFILGADYYRLDEFVKWGLASDIVMGLLTTAGTAATIAGAVYSRRAYILQQRMANLDVELGPLPAGPDPEPAQIDRPEPAQIDRPEPAVLPRADLHLELGPRPVNVNPNTEPSVTDRPEPPEARLSGESLHTADSSTDTFHTAVGNDDGAAAL